MKWMNRLNIKKGDAVFSAVALILIIVLLFVDTGFETNTYPNSARVKVEITEVDNTGVYRAGGMILQGSQICKVKVLSGEYRGGVYSAENFFMGKLEMDKVFEPGDQALAVIDYNEADITYVTLVDHYRINLELMLFLGFLLLLVLFAGGTGIKAFITFIFSILMIWKVLVPLFLKGVSPVPVSLVVVSLMTFMTITLVAGWNRKSLVAVLGSLAGSLLTCGLAVIFGKAFKIHGAILPYSESLLYSGYGHINLTEIFIAGIFIASAGALMDLSMDIAAAIHELVEKKPGISRKEAILSGFSIGRAVVGTMTTTLLLAYSGGYMSLLMVFMAQGTPLMNILNLKYVSAEILHTLVGSVGLVTVAPFTAILAGWLLTGRASAETTDDGANLNLTKAGQAPNTSPVELSIETSGEG